jgi:hypothetical protein
MLVYVSRCVALLFFQHRRCMWVVNTTLQPHKPGNGPAPIVLRVWWHPGPFWTGAEILTSTWIRSP